MTWNVPVKENCPSCGKTLFKLSGKGAKKPFCVNENCPDFLPEEKRGYRKKTPKPAEGAEGAAPAPEAAASAPASEKKPAAKKSAAKKPAAKKTAEKSAAEKPATKKKSTAGRRKTASAAEEA